MLRRALLYRQGAPHQRLDTAGWQHDHWTPVYPERIPVPDFDEHPVHVAMRSGATNTQARARNGRTSPTAPVTFSDYDVFATADTDNQAEQS